MSGRQVFLLAQALGLLLAIFVAPGFVQGCAKKVRNLSAAEIADQALGGGRALTDLERKAKAEEAFLAYYLVESRTSAVSNPDVELGRRHDIACGATSPTPTRTNAVWAERALRPLAAPAVPAAPTWSTVEAP